jgi:hypothetical protein
MYAKDTSKKIRAVFKSKGTIGSHSAPIHLTVILKTLRKFELDYDEKAAEVVRDIFRLCMAGFGPHR